MKKILFFLIIFLGLKVSVFAFTSEAWLRFGLEYGNFFGKFSDYINTDAKNSYTGSLGLNFGGYRFFDDADLGVFVHGFFAVPLINPANNNFSGYNFRFQTGLVFGFGFRHSLGERLTFKCAFGLNLLMSLLGYRDYSLLQGNILFETTLIDIGIGGDIGLKFDITERFFLSAGSIVTFDSLRFKWARVSFIDLSEEGRASGRVGGFTMVAVRPYITVGFNIFHR